LVKLSQKASLCTGQRGTRRGKGTDGEIGEGQVKRTGGKRGLDQERYGITEEAACPGPDLIV